MRVQIHPKVNTVTMPVEGIIKVVPNTQDKISISKDSMLIWPGKDFDGYRIKKALSSNPIQFSTNVFYQERIRLTNDLDERYNFHTTFKSLLGENLSSQPVEDPFKIQGTDDTKTVKEAGNFLVSMLWNGRLLALAKEIIEEIFPILEERIQRCLTDEQIRFCSSIIGLEESDTRQLAIIALTAKVRIEADLPTPYQRTGHFQIEHPSSPHQILDINDPILYSAHIVTCSLDEFEDIYLKFDLRARTYWSILAATKLYTKRDIEALDTWMKVSSDPFALSLLPTHERNVINVLDLALSEWQTLKANIEQTRLILWKIGNIGANCAINDEWPPLEDVGFSERSYWVSKMAIRELGLPEDLALGHAVSWERMDNYVLKYLFINFKDSMKGIPSDPRTRQSVLSMVIVPQAAEHVMLTQMEFKLKHAYGGVKFRFAEISIPRQLERDFSQRDLARGSEIKREILRNPRVLEEQLRNLQLWRSEFEIAFPAQNTNARDYIIEEYRRRYEAVVADAQQIRFALSNVEKINDIQKILDAMSKRLGSESFGLGEIPLPPDVFVTSVFVQEGEHLKEGRPVIAIQDRFNCFGKTFLSTNDFPTGFTIFSTWSIDIEDIPPISDLVSFTALVSRIEPTENDLWVVELNIFATLKHTVPNISGLPTVLPISQRYIDPVIPGLTSEMLDQVQQFFADPKIVEINFLNKTQ